MFMFTMIHFLVFIKKQKVKFFKSDLTHWRIFGPNMLIKKKLDYINMGVINTFI